MDESGFEKSGEVWCFSRFRDAHCRNLMIRLHKTRRQKPGGTTVRGISVVICIGMLAIYLNIRRSSSRKLRKRRTGS